LESDIIVNLNDEFIIYIPNGNDVTNRIITDIVTNINLLIPIQNIYAVQAVVNIIAPLAVNNNGEVVNNNVPNLLLDDKLIIKKATKIDAKLILMISKNFNKKISKAKVQIISIHRL